MICQCIHLHQPEPCKEEAGIPSQPDFGLCIACSLMNALGSPDHDLPVKPEPEKKLDALEPVSDQQKDKAIQTWAAESGL